MDVGRETTGPRCRFARRRPAQRHRSTGNPVLQTIARSMSTRFSRSARSPRCSPRCCLPTWWCVARWRRTIPCAKFLPASVQDAGVSTVRRSRCSISRPTHRACRACRPISRRRIQSNPYIDYTAERLYDYLSNHKLGFKPGKHLRIRQSRLRPAGPYPRAARAARVMRSSSSRAFAHHSEWTTPASRCRASMQQRLARGHNAGLAPVANWDIPALGGRRRASFDGERSV